MSDGYQAAVRQKLNPKKKTKIQVMECYLSEAQLDPPLFELLGEGFQVVRRWVLLLGWISAHVGARRGMGPSAHVMVVHTVVVMVVTPVMAAPVMVTHSVQVVGRLSGRADLLVVLGAARGCRLNGVLVGRRGVMVVELLLHPVHPHDARVALGMVDGRAAAVRDRPARRRVHVLPGSTPMGLELGFDILVVGMERGVSVNGVHGGPVMGGGGWIRRRGPGVVGHEAGVAGGRRRRSRQVLHLLPRG